MHLTACGAEATHVRAGAPFIMHRGSQDKMLRHVWVADVPQKRRAVLRWQSNKGKQWRNYTSRGDRAKLAKEQYHEAAVSLLTSVTYGALRERTQVGAALGART
jgi:hypothetical protein